ncbi:hypothetical protein ACFYZI_36715, partial [Streptomyces griseorubiginosus]
MSFVVPVGLIRAQRSGTEILMGMAHAYPATHIARRMFELMEPICLVTFMAEECNQELAALGHRTYWDGYFASRAAPLG